MKLTIKVKKEVFQFLKHYHPKPMKAEMHDELGWMILTILTNSCNESKYEWMYLKNNIRVRSGKLHPKYNFSKTITCEVANWRMDHINKQTFDCEAMITFNNYVRKLLLKTFINYMIVEVDVNNRLITDAIESFQAFYDLSDEEFSAETCKRFWQRHKNDASPHRIGLNAGNTKTRRRTVKSREHIQT